MNYLSSAIESNSRAFFKKYTMVILNNIKDQKKYVKEAIVEVLCNNLHKIYTPTSLQALIWKEIKVSSEEMLSYMNEIYDESLSDTDKTISKSPLNYLKCPYCKK